MLPALCTSTCLSNSPAWSKLEPSVVQRVLLVICVLSTGFAEHGSYVVNNTDRTFPLSYSSPFYNDFHFPSGKESSVLFQKGPALAEKKRQYVYDGKFSVPKGTFLVVKKHGFKTPASCYDGVATNFNLNVDNFITERPCPIYYNRNFTYHAGRNEATYKFTFYSTAAEFNITISIRALELNGYRKLVVSHQTNVSGTVTPHGFDGVTDYPIGLDATARLDPPPGHGVMLSFPHVDIACEDTVSLYINNTFIWAHCRQEQIPASVYQGNVSLRFYTDRYLNHSGFKIRFSYHSASELPLMLQTTRLNTAVFNCSVPFYAKFRQHLDCNLEQECIRAEDETSCRYSLGPCGPGFLNAGSKCYKYVKIKKDMNWYEAFSVCLKQGLRLATFSTFNEEEEFRRNILQVSFTALSFFFGLRTSEPSLPAMYRDAWQWSSGIVAYYVRISERISFKPKCAVINRLPRKGVVTASCGQKWFMHFFFCETEQPLPPNDSGSTSLSPVKLTLSRAFKKLARLVQCSEGHVTHDFLSCDRASRCGAEVGMKSCVTFRSAASETTGGNVEVSMFVCDSQVQTIHYTQVCDHRPQCLDSTDENFCLHRTCPEKQCQNRQCVTDGQWCDGMAHCSDASDEACPPFTTGSAARSSAPAQGMHVVVLDGYGKYRYVRQGDEFPACPKTHFLCANRDLCLPVYLRCNGVYDCPHWDDERKCDDLTCPGFYRCRGASVCVHADHVCDDVFQCPQQDDELLCQLTCPRSCRCQGLAFVCPRSFPVQVYSNLRYLDASRSSVSPDQLFHNHYLIRLALSNCGLYVLPVFVFPNMKFLDLKSNELTNVSMHLFLKMSKLEFLDFSRNPIADILGAETNTLLENFHSLDLSSTEIARFESKEFRNVRSLKNLNLSQSKVETIDSSGFGSLVRIETLDLRGTKLKKYPVKMLRPLSSLRAMFSDVYKLCCRDILPENFSPPNCHAPPNEIASCKDMLRSEIYKLFLWISCFFALLGNAGSFAARCYMQRGKPPNSFNVFIGNLNVADLLMGLYLAMIGSADQVYRGTYLWHDDGWKTGSGCKIAGFLSLLSCEMSAFIICFITLDRFLVMRFPFSQLHFGNASAEVACGLNWLVSVVLAAVPLLPATSHWQFYSQTDICIPLPVTRQNFKGHFYSFGVLIVFNFLLFVLIAFGQLLIYLSIRGNSMATDKKSEREAKVARRLLTVVMSDFLCWFPIGLLGLLASSGVPIPGEVNVAIAVFALPLNSALNPFLYTFNLLMERRQKAAEQRLLRMLQTRLAVKSGTL